MQQDQDYMGLLAENALAQPYLEQKILKTWWQQITKFSVMALNLETIADTLSWCKICQLNGSNHIRAKKNFTGNRKKLAKVRGADAETQSHLRWQFPRIWQSLRRFILESLSVNTSPSRDEQDCWKSGTSAALLQSGLDEKWWADFMECSCYLRYNSRSLVWWEDTLRKTIRRTNWRVNNPIWFADWISSYFCHGPVATESSTSRTSDICLVCKENLTGRHYVRRHRGIGKDAHIWNSCKKTRREESDYVQNWWFPSATEKKEKLLGGDQVLRTSILIRDNAERGEVHEDLRGESDGLLHQHDKTQRTVTVKSEMISCRTRRATFTVIMLNPESNSMCREKR